MSTLTAWTFVPPSFTLSPQPFTLSPQPQPHFLSSIGMQDILTPYLIPAAGTHLLWLTDPAFATTYSSAEKLKSPRHKARRNIVLVDLVLVGTS